MVQKILFVVLLFSGTHAWAQVLRPGQPGQVPSTISYDNQGRPIRKTSGGDSLQRRDSNADSITIYYRYFDSTRIRTIDSSINDFTTRFPLPYYYHTLGNYGTAAQSFLFNPRMTPGFDPGFHQYDIYKFTVENTKFYQTTRPYSELSYVIGSKAEQLINLSHTQNRKSNFNFSFEYRFGLGPGALRNQNSSHSNMRITAHYQSNSKKYEFFAIYISNKTSSSENGGLRDVKKLDSLALNDPYELESRLGRGSGGGAYQSFRNPFSVLVTTGNLYKESTLLFRHHYDLGKRDSIVTDSFTYRIFYPRFRMEHTLQVSSSSYNFIDQNVDSSTYITYFDPQLATATGRGFSFKDAWSDISNEFSLISFPDKNNQSQFFKTGIALQNLKGTFDSVTTKAFHNVYALAEYRNRTRNQVWEIEANGRLYLNGLNAGDYAAYISMRRSLGKKLGYLELGFQNVNRSPSFILDQLSDFPIKNRTNYGKENTVKLFARYENPRNGFRLGAEYFAVSNYIYFDSFYSAKQEATLFNVLHINAEKKFRLSRRWNWYTEIHLQQTTGQPPVNLPLLLTRNRIAFEGNFYTNLFLSTGLEVRYNTPYKADNYSPFIGQYFYQNTETISNRPDINVFLHFRIKSFKGFIRLENLNTLNSKKGFEFSKLNLVSPVYPSTGLWTRVGIWWNFVN